MSRRALTIALAVVVTASAPGAGCASQDTTKSGARPDPGPRTLRFFLSPDSRPRIDGDFTPIFHGREPFLPGDGTVIWNNLPRGGHEEMYCVIADSRARNLFWCRRVFVLREGQIVAAGVYVDAPEGSNPGTIPVVGGTGAYTGARGTMTSAGGGRRGLTLTIRLR